MKRIYFFFVLIPLLSEAQAIYDCSLWGVTSQAGGKTGGTIFSYNINSDTLIIQADFKFDSTGMNPYGSLFQASNGNLFATTWCGGNGVWTQAGSSCNGCGTLEEYDTTTNMLIKRFDFDYDSGPGGLPYGSVIQVRNGYLYGMTNTSLVGNGGALFQYDIATNTMTDKGHFTATFGYGPEGDLLEGSDSKLYGMTQYGGLNNEGSLFHFDLSTDSFKKLIDFNSATIGGKPSGSLIQASNGLLYGLTMTGGAYTAGTLFSYDISTGVFTKKADFSYTVNGTGCSPMGSLMQADNGKLYGLTYKGGLHNYGTLFEYDISTNVITKKYDFNGSNGKYSKGTLMQASNGKLYGMAQLGGAHSGGTLFEYDLTTDTLIKKQDFSVATGYKPAYTKLIEVCKPVPEDPLNVIIPNVFSPNGDGVNDNWNLIINHKEMIKDLSVSIFNRWGYEVYKSGDKNFTWNGRSPAGEICPDGTYYFVVKYRDTKSQTFISKGFLTLTR